MSLCIPLSTQSRSLKSVEVNFVFDSNDLCMTLNTAYTLITGVAFIKTMTVDRNSPSDPSLHEISFLHGDHK